MKYKTFFLSFYHQWLVTVFYRQTDKHDKILKATLISEFQYNFNRFWILTAKFFGWVVALQFIHIHHSTT